MFWGKKNNGLDMRRDKNNTSLYILMLFRATVLPAKSDSDIMFCLLSFGDL